MPRAEILVRSLLRWYARNARDLPWRKMKDPYAIWVSEIMLQQTQIKTVVPYWSRWMRRFPTVQVLADAPKDHVLKFWEGLGYYMRARNLHRAAQTIVTQHHGVFPREYQKILSLPGVGRYTAGAICSIAYNQPEPVLDGNVMRVLTRVFAIEKSPREARTNRRLWNLSEELVRLAAHSPSAERPCASFNQALMELGATICTPRQPKCTVCPIQNECRAFREGRTTELPKLRRGRAIIPRRVVAFVISNGERYLVRQRPAGSVNAHLWEFPNLETKSSAYDVATVARRCLGFLPRGVHSLCCLKHMITRYRIRLDVFAGTTTKAKNQSSSSYAWEPMGNFGFQTKTPISMSQTTRWCTLKQLEKLAFPSAHRKIVKALEAQRNSARRSATKIADLKFEI